MKRPKLFVAMVALCGLVIGLALFLNQPAAMRVQPMNPLGIVAFCSLGASLGCLIVDQDQAGRR